MEHAKKPTPKAARRKESNDSLELLKKATEGAARIRRESSSESLPSPKASSESTPRNSSQGKSNKLQREPSGFFPKSLFYLHTEYSDTTKKLLENLGAPEKLSKYVNDENDLEELNYDDIKDWYEKSILSKFPENYRHRASNIKNLSDVFDMLNPSNNPPLQENMMKLASEIIPEFHCVLSFSDGSHSQGPNFRTI